MSIDAVIVDVVRDDGGTATLQLGPRKDSQGKEISIAGQKWMTILNPPPGDLSGMVGTEIWGNANTLMVGQTKWAERIGYVACRLVDRKGGS